MNETNLTYCSKDLEVASRFYASFHGYVSLIVCQFGSVANVINVIVLSRREMRSPTNAILTGLAVADLLVMLDYIPYACHVYLADARADPERFSYGWTAFVLFHSVFSQVCHTISICLTLILAIWRYIAVAHPHRNREWCGMKHTGWALVLSYSLCPLLCLPLCLALTIQYKLEYIDSAGRRVRTSGIDTNNTFTNSSSYMQATMYYVQFNEWAEKDQGFYRKVNFWIYSVVIKLLPCLALTVLSTRLIFALLDTKRRRMQLMGSSIPMQPIPNGSTSDTPPHQVKDPVKVPLKSSKLVEKERQTDRTTRMLLAVLLLFLLTEFPQGILGLLSAVLGDPFFKQCYIPLDTTELPETAVKNKKRVKIYTVILIY